MLSEVITDTRTLVTSKLPSRVRIAGEKEKISVSAVIELAFSTDPISRWFFVDPADYLKYFPRFIEGFAGGAFKSETAYFTTGFKGAALWLPPGVGPDDEALESVISESIPAENRPDVFAFMEQMDKFHPDYPHWYLPMIGVDMQFQGQGIGSELMRAALERVDADGLPAYLESSNGRNIPLYERFGFEVIGTIQAGSSPPMFPMLRGPRA